MSDSLWPHGLQHARPPCPSPTPGACLNSCPSSQWCHPPSHPLSCPSLPALNLSQHQGLFQWVSSSHQVTKVLEFQLQHQSFQPSIIHTFYHISGNPCFQENTMGLLSMTFPWSHARSTYTYLPYIQNAKLKVISFFGCSVFFRQMSKSSVNLKGPGWSTANLISISQKHLWFDLGLPQACPLIASAQLVPQHSSASRSHLKGFSSAFPNHVRPAALHNTLYNGNALLLFSHSVCLSLCDPMDCSTPGLPVHHQLLELAQTHVHWDSDAIQPSHPVPSPSSPAFSLSQHQGLF